MKPFRMRMAHSLISAYELDQYMEVIKPIPATSNEMTRFHSNDYIEYLKRASPEFAEKQQLDTQKYLNFDDCPPFDGIFEFCSISSGGSISGAQKLNHGDSDIVINWSGGLHHAKKSEASGFCYVNDIVLAILELLRYHQRVLYLDIDVHHGDGVEEAFYSSDRVMTVSFHKFGEFFPGTGDLKDIGIGKGKHHAINVPLRDGIDDDTYSSIFQPIMQKVIEVFRPGAIVMQCGTDSLSGDRLGCFNLSMNGHARCVQFMKNFGIPLLCLGGGGYTVRNVARTWVYETSVLLNKEVSKVLPYNEYYEFYGPEYVLDVPKSNMDNQNSPQYLEFIIKSVFEYLRHVQHTPSVQLHEVPPDWPGFDSEAEAEMLDQDADANMETRITTLQNDRHVTTMNELEVDNDDANDDDSDTYLVTTSSGRTVRLPNPQSGRHRRQARNTKQKTSRGSKITTKSTRTNRNTATSTNGNIQTNKDDVNEKSTKETNTPDEFIGDIYKHNGTASRPVRSNSSILSNESTEKKQEIENKNYSEYKSEEEKEKKSVEEKATDEKEENIGEEKKVDEYKSASDAETTQDQEATSAVVGDVKNVETENNEMDVDSNIQDGEIEKAVDEIMEAEETVQNNNDVEENQKDDLESANNL
ncbi:hypothetical protein BB558_002853 [Smittium angustum]|uniref:histone deacetylase n=1 Tax=Smittium angustum TaxID=133377 RepID=A0A2U1J7G2_SMIAN|nr:hypothetical protein BB558_002853 [Smittium angustum]